MRNVLNFFGLLTGLLSVASVPAVAQNGPSLVSWEQSGWAQPHLPHAHDDHEPQGWLIDFRDTVDRGALSQILSHIGYAKFNLQTVSAGNRVVLPSISKILRQWLKSQDEVESVEPNQILHLFQEAPADPPPGKIENPDDPMYQSQWHFDMIDLEAAWLRADGEHAVVAVIDTGVSFGKMDGKKSNYPRVPDLQQTLFVPGYNFVNNSDDPSDGNGHGTHVAGTIAQSTNNGIGVAGIAPKAAIMPIKVLSDRGSGSLGDISKGIRFAADHGAHVINMSLGGGFYSPSMHKAIKYAHSKGVTVVCAAGNTGKSRVEYPARYPECVAVSAVGPDGELAFYSSHGEQIAVAAPGGDTRVDLNGDGLPDGVLQDTIAQGDPTQHGYFPFQGTSMATPHVAGVAALLVSVGITDPDAVREVIMSSSETRNDQMKYGSGVLDAGKALEEQPASEAPLGAFLALVIGLGFIRRQKNWAQISHASVGMGLLLVWMSGGLTFFSANFLSSPMVLPLKVWGPQMHLHPLLCNGLLALCPVLLLWGKKTLRPYLGAMSLGLGAYFLSQAGLGHVNVAWVPGHDFADTLWLVCNALMCLGLGRFVIRHAGRNA